MALMNKPSAAGLNLEFPKSLGVFDDYDEAQRVVDYLSDADFAVQDVVIVGTELRSVERITGRLTHRKVALAGVISGAWLGLFVAVALTVFSTPRHAGYFLTAPLLGAAFGLVWIQLGYRTATAFGARDFSSVSQTVATRSEVLVEHRLVTGPGSSLQRCLQPRGSSDGCLRTVPVWPSR